MIERGAPMCCSRRIERPQPACTSLPLLHLPKLPRHRRIPTCQLLDRHVLRLIVREAQIVVGAQQGFLSFLQVVDGFVDLFNGGLTR